MKTTIALIALLVVLVVGYLYVSDNNYITNNSAAEREFTAEQERLVTETGTPGVTLAAIEHASMVLNIGPTQVYVDPVGDPSAYRTLDGANIILVTHDHPDHFSTSTITELAFDDTNIVVPQSVFDRLPPELQPQAIVLANNTATTVRDVVIGAVPAYNLLSASSSATSSSSEVFHEEGEGNGYIIAQDGGIRIYVAGDTGNTPEMRALENIDIAFVPMNQPYTMSEQEAADAVISFAPRVVYPYHYRNQDGTFADLDLFESLVTDSQQDIRVARADWYDTN